MRSTMISRCSSPIPLMTVWPLSWSTATRNDGIFAAPGAFRATPIFSWSPLVFGSTATSMTGSGNSMRSSTTGWAGSRQRVAGGRVLQAGERDDVAGARFLDVLAVVGMHQQHAADALAVVLDRVQHLRAGWSARPNRSRTKVSEPTNGSVMILKARPANGSSSEHLRRHFLVAAELDAVDGGDVGRRRQDNRRRRRAAAARPCS